MKNLIQKIKIFVFLFVTFGFGQVMAQGTFTVSMYDSFGDGWNGNELRVSINAGPASVFTFANGSFGTGTFMANTGDVITMQWTDGAFTGECEFGISDPLGNVVFASTNPNPANTAGISNNVNGLGGTNNTFTVSAISMTPPCPGTNPTSRYVINMSDSFGDGWDNAFATVNVGGTNFYYTIFNGDDGNPNTNTAATWTVTYAGTPALSMTFTEGAFANEHTLLRLTNPNAVVVYQDNTSPQTAGLVYSTPAAVLLPCPSCNISGIVVNSVSACGTPTGNLYTATVTVTSTNTPVAGNLVVNGQSFPIGASPQTVTLTGLSSDGLPVTLNADFSANTCPLVVTDAFTAPAQCSDCGSIFTDPGGANDYADNTNFTETLCPDNPGDAIVVTFNSFEVELGWDALYVYDGTDATAPLFDSGNGPTNGGFPAGGFQGTTINPVFAATNPSGCLTFVFLSDGSVTFPGWNASVDCVLQPSITNSDPSIIDPCTCNNDATPVVEGVDLNDGTFSEQVLIQSGPSEVWTVTAVTGLSGVSVGDVIVETPALSGNYIISGTHVDGLGYSISASNGNFVLSQSNTCYYPDVTLTLDDQFCGNFPGVILITPVTGGIAGTAVITVDGNPATSFTPSSMTPGVHQISVVFDAGTATGGDPTDPGCQIQVIENVLITPAPQGVVCNDNVQVSLDEDCSVQLNADIILEGIDGCNSSYTIQVTHANGTVNDVLTSSDIGHTLNVSVVEISTGNSCWGTVSVEDKLAPEIVCTDVVIPCNGSIVPGSVSMLVQTALTSFSPITVLPTPLTDFQTVDVIIPVNAFANAVVNDVDVEINLTGAVWFNNINITLESPNGTIVTIWDQIGGCSGPLSAIFDDEGSTAITCANFTTGVHAAIPFNQGLLSDFDDEDANGDWVIHISDIDGFGDISSINIANLLITYTGLNQIVVDFPIATDNCAPPDLTYTDVVQNLTCTTPTEAGRIIRTWTATDPSGNTDVCTQTITLARPTIDDLTWPRDYDDLDLPALECPNADTSIAATGVPQVFGEDIVNSSICDVTWAYEDHIHYICAGSYKIVREWEVIFWCTGLIETHNQLIKVLDKTGPTISGLNDLTISTSAQSCTGSLILPVGTFTDGCSPSSLIVVTKEATSGTLNAAGTMLSNIPVTDCLGESIVTYTATDNCGNITTRTIRITVVDDKIPTPICDEITQVAVNSDCIAVVDAEVFDDGSHDNCAIDRFEVARMPSACIPVQTPFAPTVTFNCCDVSDTVMVIVRVYDECGNYNDCMVEVYVEDKEAPICLAPADQTINCDAGYNLWDLEQFGQPTFADNCDILAGFGSGNCNIDTTYTRTWNLDQCQEGVITRRWVVTDPGNLTDACEQRIYVEHVSDFRVCFPADVTFTDCAEDEAGEPQISDDDCELAAVAHDDLVFNIVDTFCYKIQRTWTVVNWCIYDADATTNTNLGIASGVLCWRDNGDGYFQYTQIIKVLDNVPPTITSTCNDVTFCDFSAEDDVPGNTDYSESCDGYAELILTAQDACSPASNLEFTWRIYSPNNTVTPLYSGTGSNASGEYPYGTYLIKWEVEDGCGNISYCEYNFTINDCKKPAVVCYFGLAAELMGVDTDGNGTSDDCMIVIWDTEFLTSWDDNCTPNSQLKLRVQRQSNGVFATVSNPANLGKSVTFTGADYDFYAPQGHAAPVRLWVGDNAGNWDFCETFVTLQNNMGACGPQAAAAIGGTLTTEENETVDQVTVTATNLGTNAVVTDVTSANGEFNVAATIGADYSVSPYRNNDPLNGVTTWDLVLITKHILDVAPLSSPYKLIAADVNNSGAITAYDLVELRKVILHINDNYPNNTAWRFVDANFVFPNASNPWATDFPEIVNIDNISSQVLDADFVALHTGDVNGSVTANILMGNEDRNFNGALVLNAAAQSVKRGETVTMTVNANDFNVQGYQFTLNFDKNALDYTGITAGALNVTAEHVGVFEGAITTSWNGTADLKGDAALFTLTFTAKADVELSNVLSISSRITPAEAYSKEGELMDVALTFNNGTITTSNVFELYQNEPNPFQGITTIGFNLPESGKATLKVYDAAGRVLKSIEREFAKGYNTVQMTKEDLNASGVLYYELSTATESATKKMIIVE